MSKCRIRLIYWLLLAAISVVGGITTDLVLGTEPFPIVVRLLGLAGMFLAHFPLKRTGRLLKLLGESEEWGCTNRLVVTDLYQCVRHPHHVGVGVFMPSLGLLIGHPWSFLLITSSQWLWILGFLFLVEERELVEKFGEEYEAYRQRVPMLFPNPLCALRVLSKPIKVAREQVAQRNSRTMEKRNSLKGMNGGIYRKTLELDAEPVTSRRTQHCLSTRSLGRLTP
jgi:protein-S-isoprenylcysteine O-methyltransferase Ste14